MLRSFASQLRIATRKRNHNEFLYEKGSAGSLFLVTLNFTVPKFQVKPKNMKLNYVVFILLDCYCKKLYTL